MLGKQEYSGENLLKKSKKVNKLNSNIALSPELSLCHMGVRLELPPMHLICSLFHAMKPQQHCVCVHWSSSCTVSSTGLSLPSLHHCLIPPHSLILICFQQQLLPHLKLHPFFPEYRRGKQYEWSVLQIIYYFKYLWFEKKIGFCHLLTHQYSSQRASFLLL